MHKMDVGDNTVQPDFANAHERHLSDAHLLLANQRYANADQLYGFSAECGLKQLMMVFGMHMDQNGEKPYDPQDRKHIDALWARYETYRSTRQAMGYELNQFQYQQAPMYSTSPTNTPRPHRQNPFSNWSASQRYVCGSSISQDAVTDHAQAAKFIHRLIQNARMQGLIP
jgi:hypothetical protein